MENNSCTIKSGEEIEKMRRAGHIVALCHQALQKYIKPGRTGKQIDEYVNKIIVKNGGKSIIKNYDGFPGYNCISINDCVVHGIGDRTVLKRGDIVGVDISVIYDGYVGDSCWTYAVGKIKPADQYLLTHTEAALYEGLKACKPGNKIGDISNAIETYAKAHNLAIVKELAGHGLGKTLHEDPFIPNYGQKNTGMEIKEGMTFAIEPMLNLGTAEIYLKKDNWSVMTADKSNSAHYEHSVVVTAKGCEILTKIDQKYL